jgi:NodT family efflux transporter outer membrane factor (OMF) lipoprotein
MRTPSKWMRMIAVAILAAGINSCVTPPRDQPALTPIANQTLGLGAGATPHVGDGWWQAYGDPQLDRLIAQAFTNSPSLAQAVARLDSAKAQADFARAGALPSFALDATETRQRFSDTDIIPPPYGGGYFWRGSVMADFSWDIDFWGRQRALIREASAQTQAASLDIESARLSLAGAIAQAYVDLDHACVLADIATQAEQQRQRILDLTHNRVEAGLDTNVELRQAEGALPQARLERKQAEASAILAKHQLALLAGDGANAYDGIGRPQLHLDAALPLPDALPVDLLAHRPDVIAARLRVDAADSARLAAKAAFYPSVNLAGFAGWGSIGLEDLIKAPSQMYGLGPSIHLPLFDTGRLKSGYRGAVAQIDAAVADYNQTVLRAVKDVADALARIEALDAELTEQQQVQAAAEDAYRLAELRYRSQLTNYLTVLGAESQVLSARRQRADLIAQLAVSRVTLLLSLGGSFDSGTATTPPLALSSSLSLSLTPIATATEAKP